MSEILIYGDGDHDFEIGQRAISRGLCMLGVFVDDDVKDHILRQHFNQLGAVEGLTGGQLCVEFILKTLHECRDKCVDLINSLRKDLVYSRTPSNPRTEGERAWTDSKFT